jgi:16S rRNA processing protein RimM
VVRIGVVARPHGVRGMVAVTLDDPEGTALLGADHVYLGTGSDDPRRIEVIRATTGRKGQVLLALEGIATPEAAEALRGRIVLLEEEQLPALEEGEYRLAQLIGLQAVDRQGAPVGRVTEVVDTAEVPVLVVAARGAEVYVPFAVPHVVDVDVAGGRIVVDPPEEG